MSGEVTELERQVDVAPAEWRQVTLGNVVRIITDGISAADLAALPKVHHYSLPAFDEGAGPEVGPGDTIKSNKTVVPDDCVLFSKLNPRIPRIWRVRGEAPPHSYCSTEFWPLVAQGVVVDLDYLTHYLSSPAFLGHPDISPSSSTNSHQRVDRKAFERFVFMLPPLDEQRRIAEVLGSVDEAIAAKEAELNGLRNVANAVIEKHCRSASSDGTSPIGDFATFVGSGVTPKGGKDAYVDQGVAFIRSQNVHFDGLRAEGLAFIDAVTDSKMARTRVHPDDVLLNITGASIGRCTIVPKDFGPANVNQHVCIIRPNPAEVLPSYLSLFLSSHDGQRQIDQLQGGLSREGLNYQQVRAISVPTPPLDVQSELAETIGATRSMMQALERDLAGMKGMRSGISGDLLSGRVRVPE